MHLVGLLPSGVDDRAVSGREIARGVEAPALSRQAVEPLSRGGLVLGYVAFSPRAIRTALQDPRRRAPHVTSGGAPSAGAPPVS